MTTSPESTLVSFVDTAMDTGLHTSLDITLDSCQPGLPADRDARIAARRAFVAMKLLFMRAVQALDDRKGQWLRYQVRLASDPIDLWLLRGPVLGAVRNDDARSRALRAELYRGLDSIFPEAFGLNPAQTRPAPLAEAWIPPAGQAHEARAHAN
ncbi:MAG TPA: hypothetical protein VLA16_25880 [Ideonella sp.]|nr:hypothetical protein [Ideonella sp.]